LKIFGFPKLLLFFFRIHYFGRKFQGTDILQILRRKRMLERRFAMGEGKEFIEFVIKHERE